jgi:NodT family efflux transporter outer membrane factor (OMF) lipoprotein
MRAVCGALLVTLTLCSCAVATRRGVDTRALDGAQLGLSSLSTPPIPDRWWETFGDPQLNALVERATRNSPSLAQALARLQQATALARASDAALRPRVDASLNVARERLSERYIIPPPYGGSTYWDSQLNLALSWDPDFWGRQRAMVLAGGGRVRASALDARAAQLALQSALITAYVEFDREQALADVAEQFQVNRVRLAELTRKRYAAGIDNQVELAVAAAPVPAARLEFKQLQARTDLLRHQLAELSGQGAEGYSGITRSQLTLTGGLPLPNDLPGDLLLRRPDIQAALARVQAADADAEAARLAKYPDIRLSAFIGTAGLSLDDLLAGAARTHGLGSHLLLPIFDAGQLRARYQVAGAELGAAIATYNGMVLRAVREVADQLSLLRAYAAERSDAQQQFNLSSDALRLAERRQQAGIAAEQSVLDIQARVFAAHANLISTQALEAESRIALLIALGGNAPTPAAATVPAKESIP